MELRIRGIGRMVLANVMVAAIVLILTSCPTGVGSGGGDSADGGTSVGDDTTATADVVLVVTQAGAGRITVEWEEPGDDDYSHLVLSIDPADAAEAGVDKGTTTYQFTGLTGDKEYTITAKSVDETGNLSAGTTVTLTLPVDEMEVKMISTAAELTAIDDDLESLNDYYILTADIDLEAVEWEPIASESEPFSGVFEGNSHTILNLYYDSTLNGTVPREYVGLFAYLDGGGAIRGIDLVDVEVVGAGGLDAVNCDSVGGLVGHVENGLLHDCSVTGTVRGEGVYPNIGGLVGTNGLYGAVSQCSSSASLEGRWATGGLVGLNVGHIDNSNASGTVVGGYEAEAIGGLVGVNVSSDGIIGGLVTNSHSTGAVSGDKDVGGLVGWFPSGEGVFDCHAEGTVSGPDDSQNIGGLIGSIGDGYAVTVDGCYASGNVSGHENVGGLIGLSQDGTVTGSHYVGDSVEGTNYVGGLIGHTYSVVAECYAVTNVGDTYIEFFFGPFGGLIGGAESTAEIYRSFAEGTVEIDNGVGVGGLIGYNTGLLEDCYARGSARALGDTQAEAVGGLVGLNSGAVHRSYSTGEVTGLVSLGGLVGDNNSGSVTDSFYNTDTSGMSDSGKGTSKTTAELTAIATLTDTATAGLETPWDFVGDPNDDSGSDDYWDIGGGINDGYPHLTGLE